MLVKMNPGLHAQLLLLAVNAGQLDALKHMHLVNLEVS